MKDIKATFFLFSIFRHKPFSNVFNDQCNLRLSKPILAKTLNLRGNKFANISKNYVPVNISKSTVHITIDKNQVGAAS